ncbi:MAG: hypothetical protein DRJ32_01830 [Thermoprotei archaeon]|nr:MAG: hypothetical protein DRJ32_01830 [Thermoprotei archaeon]
MSTGVESRVKLEELKVSKYNVRGEILEPFKDARVIALANDIIKRGLINKLIVIKENEHYGIVCGKLRYYALLYIRTNHTKKFYELFPGGLIPVEIRKLKPKEAVLLSLAENVYTNSLSNEELASAIIRLKTEYNLTDEDISKSTGLELDRIKLLSYIKSIRDSLNAILVGPGRPTLTEREKSIGTLSLVIVKKIADLLKEKGIISEDEVDAFVLDTAEKVIGLPSRQLRLMYHKIQKEPKKYKQIIQSFTSKKLKALNIAIDEKLVEKIKKQARKQGKLIDEVVEELIKKAFSTS